MTNKRNQRGRGPELLDTLTTSGAQRVAQGEWTLAEFLAVTPEDGATLSAMARHYYSKGELETAQRILLALTRLNPRDAHSTLLLGISFHAMELWTEAAAAYGRALQLDSSLHQARLNRALVALDLGQRQQALDDAEALMTADVPHGIQKHARRLLERFSGTDAPGHDTERNNSAQIAPSRE